ncbi:IS701 family transposase [Streptomyces sp. NPDC004065]|uniref:IS701 family transposase n=1 Tax=Streptomyces sp. NPDC004065 TaxID=3364689 RepID=UPI00384BDB8B
MNGTRARLVPAGVGIHAVDTLVEELFGYLPRTDQRRWAHVYLRGLLLTEGKKSMRRLAESVSASPTAWYSLQQFINSSPWEWEPARDALTRWVEERSSVRAWTLTPVVLPKRGDHSVGVHQRFVPSTGRRLNCQLGIALFLSCPGANFPVDWRLFLPRQWTDDSELRRRARIPKTESFQPQWKHMLDLVDSMVARTSSPAMPVVADISDATDFGELTSRLGDAGRDFIVAVNPRQLSPGAGNVRERAWSRRMAAVTGADGMFRQAQVLSTLARRQTGDEQRTYRLFTELDPGGRPGSQVWLTNLVHHRLDELLELTRLHISSTVTADLMDRSYGLLDFAGRSFPAWHHHMTMASAAYTHMRLAHAAYPMEPLLAGQRSA